MTGFPPGQPPGPGFGPPFAGNLRSQARAAARQNRAQRRQERSARKQAYSLHLQQRRGLRRTSLLAPLLLLTIGIVALLVRAGHPPLALFFSWYGHWWPLLFLFAGMFLLIEWACDLFLLTATPALPRRLGAGATLLLLALAAFGASTGGVRQAQTLFGNDIHLGLGDFDEFLTQKHESTRTIDTPFPAGTRLSVDSPHGNITILGAAEDGQAHIVVNKQVYTDSDSDALQLAQQLDPQISLSGTILQVTLPKLVGATADLTLTLPASAAATLNAQHGSVEVSTLHAPVTITADHGDITCKAITGAVNAQLNRNSSSFTAHDITGDVLVHGHAQDLTLTNVSGQVTLEGEFFGNTHLEHLQGPVAFRTHRSQLTLVKLLGQVDISPDSELTGSQMVGPILLHTSSRNVSFDRIAGDVSITDSKGTVNLSSAAPLGNIDVQNRDGAVTLTVPQHAGLTVDATTHGGRIDTDLGLDPVSQGSNQVLQGTVRGGGPRVTIRTSHLDIDIHQGNIQPPTEP